LIAVGAGTGVVPVDVDVEDSCSEGKIHEILAVGGARDCDLLHACLLVGLRARAAGAGAVAGVVAGAVGRLYH